MSLRGPTPPGRKDREIMTGLNPPEQGQRRVFLSYAQADKDVALSIAGALRGSGLHVWFAEWELAQGDSIAERVDAGLASSDVLVVLLSPAALASRWVAQEMSVALLREVRDRAIAVIPVLIGDCEIPPLLAGRTYLDLRSDREAGIARLVSQIGAASALELSQLGPRAFENLVADLLSRMGYSVERTSPHGHDGGIDIIAVPSGKKDETWFVQTKFYHQQRVSVDALRQMQAYLSDSDIKRGLIVTNGRLTSVAREMLAEWTKKSGPELRVIDGDELTNLLLPHPELVRRYFAETGKDE